MRPRSQPCIPTTSTIPSIIDPSYTAAHGSFDTGSQARSYMISEGSLYPPSPTTPMTGPPSLWDTQLIRPSDASRHSRQHTSLPNLPYNISATSITAGSSTEPPRHSQPLYNYVPLPNEDFVLQPALRFNFQPEWYTPHSSPPILRNSYHRSELATSPGVGALIILFPWANIPPMIVNPPSSSLSRHANFVTIGNVLDAIDTVVDTIDTRCLACLSLPHVPGRPKRCMCLGAVRSIEYLRRRYGRAGLLYVDVGRNTWALSVS